MSSTALRWNGGRSSLRQPEHAGDDRAPGTGTISSRTRSASPRSTNASIVLVDDRPHEVGLPALHRLAGERLLDERAVLVVLGLVHLEDRVAHHQADAVGVAGRRERLAVLAAPAARRRTRAPRPAGRRARETRPRRGCRCRMPVATSPGARGTWPAAHGRRDSDHGSARCPSTRRTPRTGRTRRRSRPAGAHARRSWPHRATAAPGRGVAACLGAGTSSPVRAAARRAGEAAQPGGHGGALHDVHRAHPAAGEPGYYGEPHGRYLADRARGGVGRGDRGQAAVHPTTAYQMPNNAAAWRPEAVPHFRRLTDQVHEHGAAAFLQLAHNGGVIPRQLVEAAACSPRRSSPTTTSPPSALDDAGIAELVEAFAVSAATPRRAGSTASRSTAPTATSSTSSSRRRPTYRDDRYGGSPREPDALRRRGAGRGPGRGRRRGRRRHPPGRRRGAVGRAPASRPTTPPRSPRGYEAMGLVDFLNVSVGTRAWAWCAPTTPARVRRVGRGARSRPAVGDTPVFAVHRILDPDQAEGDPRPTAEPTASASCGP